MAFIDEIATDKDLKSVHIDQWGKTIYFTTFTLADMDYANRMSKGKEGEFIAYTLIRKCLDENGKPRFSIGDKQKLMRSVQSDVLANIVIEMKKVDTEVNENGEYATVEDKVKN